MPKGLNAPSSTFLKLVEDIRRLIEQGRKRAKSAANQELVKTYWAIGSRIEQEGLTKNAGYGEAVMDKLAEDLSTDPTTLIRCVQFYRLYSKAVPQGPLTWSHFRLLLSLGTDKERLYYQQKAETEGWTRDQLGKAIQSETYQGTIPGKRNSLNKLLRPTGGPFVYRAEVVKVVDGDTLLLRVDLGFTVWKEQRFRLTSIDSPVIDEDGGPEAYEYVQTQLSKAKVVVVRTGKIDIYGRYTAHVFYSFDENHTWEEVFKSGRWLNNELIERGLARFF